MPDIYVKLHRWADQCPNEHDKNRLIPGFAFVGQNMADSWNSANKLDKDLAGKVTAWYDEVKIFFHILINTKLENYHVCYILMNSYYR